jgi:ketosteroid isomerase-like protein
MRKLGILGASLFLAPAVPALAQDLRDEVGKVATAYEQHFNKKDAAGITSLYTKNYLRVNSAGVVADNTKLYEVLFKGGFDHLEGKITEISL